MIFSTVFAVGLNPLLSQDQKRPESSEQINWQGIQEVRISEFSTRKYVSFENALIDNNLLPVLKKQYPLNHSETFDLTFNALETAVVTGEELQLIEHFDLDADFKVSQHVSTSRKLNFADVTVIPFRKQSNGVIEKLISYELNITPGPQVLSSGGSRDSRDFAASSVMENGDWYKIGITNSGIYKVDYNFLTDNGVDPGDLNINSIHLFGNSFAQLPEDNGLYRPDDLLENPIQVYDLNNNGILEPGEYFIFYGKQSDRIVNNGTFFTHRNNPYSDTSYYFINIDSDRTPKRIQQVSSDVGPATHTVNSYNDFRYIDKDEINFIKSGSEWFGDIFDLLTTRSYTLGFNNIVNSQVQVIVNLAAKHFNTSSFTVTETNSGATKNFNVAGIPATDEITYARGVTDTLFFTPASNTVNLSITYSKPSAAAKGWLNYIAVNARRDMIYSGISFPFKDLESVGVGNIANYEIANGNLITNIWEVTNPSEATSVDFTVAGNVASFIKNADSLREFIAFSGSSFTAPKFFNKVDNQNLHGLSQADYLIISYAAFKSEADRLADFHRERGLDVHVVTTSQVYNEFSSGMQDPVAIRDFLKMFYERAGSNPHALPKYALLFGDGSYDNKHRFASNHNFVVTYQSPSSLSYGTSYTSDDFFGFLDTNESMHPIDRLDIAIGRFCVKSIGEAKNMVDKTIHYATNSSSSSDGSHNCDLDEGPSTLGNWRNIIAIASDDEDGGKYVSDAESYDNKIHTSNPEINLEKIYLDAYVQESTPGGERYYEVQRAVDNRITNGCLVFNYIGHGGEVGLAHERILDIPTINSWTNYNNLPLFMTATCEFTRFDDPERVSAGELTFLNPIGGAFALFTTTRVVYTGQNSAINNAFYSYVFDENSGIPITIGETFMQTKNDLANPSNENHRNFTLIGDPAIPLALPKHHIVTDSVNNIAISVSDTLGALSTVTISGHIENNPSGTIKSDFNGFVFPTVYDKQAQLSTLGNNSDSPILNFESWRNIIYRGKASVVNGYFKFSFVVPKDIAYQIGPGRVSYYAHDGTIDAHGYSEDIYIGGADTSAVADSDGPEIELYMNDENFVSGSITDENPKLFALVFDENGVNTVGNGIGHDITAILDEKTSNAIILNDYYESDLDTYKSGRITYPFSELDAGPHTLSLKVWDVHNNSGSAEVEFVVSDNAEIALDHVLNYPNPFTTNTTFFFEHNQSCEDMAVQIQIFTISGKLVKTLNQNVHTDGFKIDGINWDGRDEYGDNIGKGVYVYKVKVATPDGKKAEETEKLVILR